MHFEGYCNLCGEDLMSSGQFYKNVLVCSNCMQFLEENDGYTGKLMVDSCKECGHIKKAWFKKYKKRGRKLGSKNKEVNHILDELKGDG